MRKKERTLGLFPAVGSQKQNRRYAWKTSNYPTFWRTGKYLEIAYGEDGSPSFRQGEECIMSLDVQEVALMLLLWRRGPKPLPARTETRGLSTSVRMRNEHAAISYRLLLLADQAQRGNIHFVSSSRLCNDFVINACNHLLLKLFST